MTPFEAGRCADQVWRVVESLLPVGLKSVAAIRLIRAFSPGAEFYKHSPIVEATGVSLAQLEHYGAKFRSSTGG